MTGVVKAVAHGASPRQDHAGYLPTRATSNMAGTSTPFAAGAAGRRARIIRHGSKTGAQQHQEATPGRGAAAQDQLKLTGNARFRARATPHRAHPAKRHCAHTTWIWHPRRRAWDGPLGPGTGGAGATEVRSRARAAAHRGEQADREYPTPRAAQPP